MKRLPPREASAAVAEAVAVRLTVQVKGRVRPGAQVTLAAPRLTGGAPIEVTTVVRNTGNVRLDFDRANKGLLAVRQGSVEKAAVAFRGPLYPRQQRVFVLSWEDAPSFGRFRATAAVDTGPGGVTRSRTVFVFPWRQVLALLFVAGAALILLGGRRRSRKRLAA